MFRAKSRLFERYSDWIKASQKWRHGLKIIGRCYLASMFFFAGWSKATDFDATLRQFMQEYQVPMLDEISAAYFVTSVELTAPILLILGLATRFTALMMTVANLIMLFSIEQFLPVTLSSHLLWTGSLLQILILGAGPFSADCLIRRRLQQRKSNSVTLY